MNKAFCDENPATYLAVTKEENQRKTNILLQSLSLPYMMRFRKFANYSRMGIKQVEYLPVIKYKIWQIWNEKETLIGSKIDAY